MSLKSFCWITACLHCKETFPSRGRVCCYAFAERKVTAELRKEELTLTFC